MLCCGVGIVQRLINLLYYVIWWLHLSEAPRNYCQKLSALHFSGSEQWPFFHFSFFRAQPWNSNLSHHKMTWYLPINYGAAANPWWFIQGAKKVSFTVCHSSKLQLSCTSPKVISTSPNKIIDLQDRIDCSSVIWISLKTSLARWASYQQNALAQ